MKKLLYFIIVLIVLIYILAEFIGDSVIKGSLEENLSKNLDRQVSIESLDISYLSGEANLENIKIKNKIFKGDLLNINKAFAKLNISSIFSDKIEIDQISLNGIDFNYYFELKKMKINDNIKSLKESVNKKNTPTSTSKEFLIKKLEIKNIVVTANSEKLNLNKKISVKDLDFENVGNTKNSKNYKTVIKETVDDIFKNVKSKVLSSNIGNNLDKIKNIDQDKVKEKVKKELLKNKDKVKDKLKKLLNKN